MRGPNPLTILHGEYELPPPSVQLPIAVMNRKIVLSRHRASAPREMPCVYVSAAGLVIVLPETIVPLMLPPKSAVPIP